MTHLRNLILICSTVIIHTAYAQTEPVGTISSGLNVSPSGSAIYSISIEVPKGVHNLAPQVSIVYNSHSGSGTCGWGCNLTGFSAITRGTKDVWHDGISSRITYSDNDAFYLDGQRLIETERIQGADSIVYCLESDPYVRVVKHNGNSDWFSTYGRDGMLYEYGKGTARQQYSESNGLITRTNAWYVSKVTDACGNYMDYNYFINNLYVYPSSITYGSNSISGNTTMNRLEFSYGKRSDRQGFAICGKKGGIDRRLNTITAFTNDTIYRRYTLSYALDNGTKTPRSRLQSVTVFNKDNEQLRPIQIGWNAMNDCQPIVEAPNITLEQSSINVTLESNFQLMASDFNGDGISDIVQCVGADEAIGNANQHYTYLYFYRSHVDENSGAVSFGYPSLFKLSQSIEVHDWSVKADAPMVADIDGDGLNDFILHYIYNAGGTSSIMAIITGSDICSGNGQVHSTVCNLNNTSTSPITAAADFDNNGKADFALLEKDGINGTYNCHVGKDGSDLFDFSFVTCQLPVPASPQKMFVSDFNSDGLQDLAVFYTGGCRIFWNTGNGLTANTFGSSYTTPSSNITDCYRLYEGDFNGDGLLDFLSCEQDSQDWYYILSDGSGSFTRNLACSIDAYDQSGIPEDDGCLCCSIFDIDGDGKSDAVISKTKFSHSSFLHLPYETNTFWLLSNGNSLDTLRTATLQGLYGDLARLTITGDFNGDGMVELLNYGRDIYNNIIGASNMHLYRNQSFSIASGKVTSVTDGYSRSSYISYKSLSQDSVYTRYNDGAYPFVDCQIPLHVVSTVTEQRGSIADQTTRYHYGGLKLHLLGKGLQGFTKTTSTDVLHNIVNETTTVWDTIRICPESVTQQQTIYGAVTGVMTTKSTFSYIQPVSGRPSRLHYLSKRETTGFDGETSEEHFYHNTSNGMLYRHTIENDDNLETEEWYSDFVYRHGRYLPKNKLTTRWYKNNAAYNDYTHIDYDSHGLPASVITHYNTPLALTTSFTYDSYGNVLSQQATGSGITPQVQQYVYDPTHRFVARKTENGLLSTSYTYDLWGDVLTVTDDTRPATPLTTSNSYDGWGRLSATETPTGQVHTVQRGWGTTAGKCYYVLKEYTDQPWVRTWYDSAGREVVRESVGPKGMAVADSTSYNDLGLVSRHKTKRGQLQHTDNYTYDARGRLSREWTNLGSSKDYTYSKRFMQCSDNGRTKKHYYDSWNNITKTVGPLGVTVETLYQSNGKPKRVISDGKSVLMTYDEAGNRITLTDPDAGLQSYVYDALGRVIKQTDARGDSTVFTYNAFGQVASIVTNGSNTRNFNYATTGNNLGRLMSESGGGRTIAYTYDQYDRLATKQVSGNAGVMSYAYTYNAQGLLSQKNMTGCPAITYTYDTYGFKTATQLGGQNVWSLTSDNGMIRQIANGATVSITTVLNSAGNPSTILAKRGNQSIAMFQYTWNNNLGNLTVRKGMLAQQENFTYDGLDRLTKTTVAGQENVYCYTSNGNITFKTGIGNYEYDDTAKPHAVVGVDNTDALIPLRQQLTTYGVNGKIQTIEEPETGRKAQFLYGADNERTRMTCYRSQTAIKDFYYLPDIDIVQDYETVDTRRFYHVDENVLFVKSNRYPDGKVFFLVTDHLGSVVRIVDNSGAEFFAASYDAWGRQTITRDSLGYRRGYTGHEHLPEFGLINMNGRLYDPLIGRFLSCDNYVQEPTNSQNFNRYSYCLNNPMKFTDPSGEIPVFSALAGFVKGTISLITGHGHWYSPFYQSYKDFTNDIKVLWGLTKGSTWQVLSRFTWELPQTIIGYTYTSIRFAVSDIDKVRYFGGATYVIDLTNSEHNGITIGSLININSKEGIPENNNGKFAPYSNELYAHEYGHYLQSQSSGWWYLPGYGLPSLLNQITDKEGHYKFSKEVDANRRAADYFIKEGLLPNWPYKKKPI